jgi:glucose/arabinose dehydrogenase
MRQELLPTSVCATLLLVAASAFGQGAPPLAIGGDARVDPTAFRVTRFAEGLDFPLGMVELSDGSLLVGVNRQSFAGSSLLNSNGELVRLVDGDRDGIADGPEQVLASGFEAITSVRRAGNLVFVATGAIGTPRLHVLRRGAAPGDPLTPLGSLDFVLPLPWSHLTFSLSARPRPWAPGEFELFFNLGSREDAAVSTDLVPVSGLWTGSLLPDALYRVHLDDTGPSLVVVGIDTIAVGLRNSFGHAFEPATGHLFLQDNGMDVPKSADELNVIRAPEIGGAVEDFGFPFHYVAYPGGTLVGSGGQLPLVSFLPLPGGAESKGAVELAFAPPRFGALTFGLFVAFHGGFGTGTANTSNPLVWVDPTTGEFFHFVAPGQAGVGHLDSLLATGDTLYAADLTNASGLETYGSGTIYAIHLPPACDDGRDNDDDGTVDWAGLDANGDGDLDDPGDLPPDTVCEGDPDRDREAPRCGLGFEFALVVAIVARARRRRGPGPAPR